MTPQAGSGALCSVEDLSVRLAGADGRPPRTLVDGISLRIDAGDYFALVGESGSGKSMTCHSIMRLLPQGLTASGRILFEGRDILGLRPSEMAAFRRAKVGMVFQDPFGALNPVRTIGEQMLETLRLHHPADGPEQLRNRAIEALRRVHVSEPG